jgi:hypothetical protein
MMPLFGPNVKKMTEQRDIQGLVRLCKAGDARMRLEATRALSALASIEGLAEALMNDNLSVRLEAAGLLKKLGTEGHRALADSLITELKVGKLEQKIEALIKLQGRAPHLLIMSLMPESYEVFNNGTFSGKLPLELVHDALRNAAFSGQLDGLVTWFTLIALVELGARWQAMPELLVTAAQDYLAWSKDSGAGAGQFAPVESVVREETMRALSYFRDSDLALDVLSKEAAGTPLLAGYQKPKRNPLYAIRAIGALGRPEAQQQLQFLANRAAEGEREAAQVALKLFGQATYDEIAAKAH